MQPKRKLFLGHINIANCITLLGLILSLSSCFFALIENIKLSITFLIAAGICDLFDGVIARKIKRTNEEKDFGIQLDTVVDVVSFGITPAVIVFTTFDVSWYALVIYAFYIICAVTRLAYFNTSVNINTVVKYYRGLPVTYIALILPCVMIFRSSLASVISLFVVGILYIFNINVPKPRGIWYAIFPITAIIMTILWWVL